MAGDKKSNFQGLGAPLQRVLSYWRASYFGVCSLVVDGMTFNLQGSGALLRWVFSWGGRPFLAGALLWWGEEI